jgi:amino-acid N-acetyltransferase
MRGLASVLTMTFLGNLPVLPRVFAMYRRRDPLMRTRKAELPDARAIYQLVDSFSHDGTLLHRSYEEICKNIRTFTIVETDSKEFIGCAALHVYGLHLAEVRSIVVRPEVKGRGAGGLLLRSLLDQAKENGIKCVCLFTRNPTFFEHFRFRITRREALRDKVLKDCLHCARRNNCDETAMAIGELPASHETALGDFTPPLSSGDLVQLHL